MTVKELIDELSKYPPDLQVTTVGVDCGGYDAIDTDEVAIWQDGNRLRIQGEPEE